MFVGQALFLIFTVAVTYNDVAKLIYIMLDLGM